MASPNDQPTDRVHDFFRDPCCPGPEPRPGHGPGPGPGPDPHRPPHDHPMKTDVYATSEQYLLEIEMPGFNRSDIQAELDKGYLTITAYAPRHVEEGPVHSQLIHRERFDGPYRRSFYVGDEVQPEEIKAAYTSGLLKITIPRKDKRKIADSRKYIEIK